MTDTAETNAAPPTTLAQAAMNDMTRAAALLDEARGLLGSTHASDLATRPCACGKCSLRRRIEAFLQENTSEY